MPAKRNTPADFWRRVDRRKPNECWLWKGACYKSRMPYGRANYENRRWLAHRLAFFLSGGDVDAAPMVLHSCDNPRCCNPAHLRAGTAADNMRDKSARGRCNSPAGERNGQAKITDAAADEIRNSSEKGVVLARKFAISQSTVSEIRSGKKRAKRKGTAEPVGFSSSAGSRQRGGRGFSSDRVGFSASGRSA